MPPYPDKIAEALHRASSPSSVILTAAKSLGIGPCRCLLLPMLAGAMVLALIPSAYARDPLPSLSIPLQPLGYQSMVSDYLLSGGSMLSVDFVDPTHLLVTFGIHRLMKREVADPATDQDRTVAASLVELPSGKVIARTEWRLHDSSQYLWNLGHGRFLLRVRDQLTAFAPLAGKPADAFQEYPFLHVERHILAILLSPEEDLLTVETIDPAPPAAAGNANMYTASASTQTNPAPVQINFYRMTDAPEEKDKMLISSAGVIRARMALALPLTTAGFLDVVEGGRNRWIFNFDAHSGKVEKLAQFDTTCFPRVTFVSHSEFVAFGCRGALDRQNIGGFNLKGDFMWQQSFFDTHTAPAFSFAPSAGRFALERTIVSGAIDPGNHALSGGVSSQEVRIYQTYNGKLLLRLPCNPVVRAGQNFALSPDGMRFAILREITVDHKSTKLTDAYTSREAAVEIYTLPELSRTDQTAVREAEADAPRDTGERIGVATRTAAAQSASADAAAAEAITPTPVAAPQAPSVDTAPTPGTTASGDATPEAPRKPPTLYGPDESRKPQ